MNDREFFEALLAAFTATTGAENAYWEPVKQGDTWNVYAVGAEERTLVAAALEQHDAEWVCAIHGTLPDIVRRVNMALDEADRADAERDEREHLIAELSRQQRGSRAE